MASRVMTVLGSISQDDLGRVLPHEHIASVYGVSECQASGLQGEGKRYERPRSEQEMAAWQEQALEHYVPIFNRLRESYDCRTIVEVSYRASGQTRDVELWAELSRRTGVHIVCATGYYTSLLRPRDFATRSANELADGMIKEATEGIDGTNVRAGIIKIGIGDFGPEDRKLCQAAAIVQRETGLSITTHTCSPSVRRGTLDFLEGAGVPPERIYLGHADDNATLIEMLELVRRGVSVLFTIWGIQNSTWIGWDLPILPRYQSAELVAGLAAEGYCSQILVSIDSWGGFVNGKVVEYQYEVEGRTALYLFTHVLDMLRMLHVPDVAIERMLRHNPRRMLLTERS